MTYAEQLMDPRWKEKRLEIIKRDDYTCQRCYEYRCVLQVHHLHYYPGRKPWEYENGDLITLCDACHESVNVRIPREEITNPWIIYDRLKKSLPGKLSHREYQKAISEICENLHL